MGKKKQVDAIKVHEVIEACRGGAAIARHLKISRSAVHHWTRVPVDHVLAIEKFLDKRITRYQMRPDIYPSDE